MLGDIEGSIYDVFIDFAVKFLVAFCVEIFHNLFVVNTLTLFPALSEQRRFLPVNVGVNRLFYVCVSLCTINTYVDTVTGVSPTITKRPMQAGRLRS
jgi:hypothetical protein